MASKTASEQDPFMDNNGTDVVVEKSNDESLEDLVSELTLNNDTESPPLFICDAGYGLPSQARPRKEKIGAISKQLYNFLQWHISQIDNDMKLARVQVVGDDAVVICLRERLQHLWKDPLPSHVTFSTQSLQECISPYGNEVVYLSPDAPTTLNPCKKPPNVVIVGLLIDRRIQPNRSQNRASTLKIPTAKWPLQECFANIDAQEPLNVDTILEGMQEWHWSCDQEKEIDKECFVKAATNAIERHAQRHPNRPLHKT